MIQLTPELQAAVAPIQQLAAQNQPTPPSAPAPAGQDALSTGIPTATTGLAGPLQNALSNPANGVPLSFNDKLHANVNDAADNTPPAAQGKPGSWARQLVSGAVSSLSTGLGDVAAAAPAKGILGGIGAVQNARADRIQKERKAQTEEDQARATIALTNVQKMYHQTQLHQLSDEINHADVAEGQKEFQHLTKDVSDLGFPPATIVAQDISEAQYQAGLKDGTINPSTMTIIPTNTYTPIGKDGKPAVDPDTGLPNHAKMYSVVIVPKQLPLSEDQIDTINKYGNGPKFTYDKDHPIVLPGATALNLVQSARDAQTVQAKAESDRKAAQIADLTQDQKLAQAQALKNLGPQFPGISAQSESLDKTMKFITGQHMIQQPEMGADGKPTGKVNTVVDPRSAAFAQAHPTAAEDFMNLNGGYVDYVKSRDTETEKLKDQANAPLDKIEKDLPEMEPTKLPSTISFLQQKLKDPNADKPQVTNLLVQAQQALVGSQRAKLKEEEDKNSLDNPPTSNAPLTPELQSQINSLPAPQKAVLSAYDPNTQSALMSIAFGNGEQDLEKNFPSRLTKGAPGLNTQQALGVLHQLNPQWSEQSYGVKHDAYKSATSGKLADQRDSLNNFIGHAAEAKRISDTFWNSDPRLFKSTINKLSTLGYGTSANALREALEIVNSEALTMIKSGYAATADEIKAQNEINSADATVGQIDADLKVLARMGTVRANTMNGHYKTATGDNFPNLIDTENQNDARYLGIPVEKFYTGGRIGGSGNAPQQQVTQTGAPGQSAGAAAATPNAAPVEGTQPSDFFGQFGGKPR